MRGCTSPLNSANNGHVQPNSLSPSELTSGTPPTMEGPALTLVHGAEPKFKRLVDMQPGYRI
jgi:hypothetical protein